jgi:hypothetical protein
MPLASRDYTPREILDECEHAVVEDNAPDCQMTHWLRAHVDTITIEDFEREISTNLTWGPISCYAIVRDAYRHNSGQASIELQRLYCGFLVKFPFHLARGGIESLLHNPLQGGPWDPVAQQMLVDAVATHHRRGREFIDQSSVRANIVKGVVLDRVGAHGPA